MISRTEVASALWAEENRLTRLYDYLLPYSAFGRAELLALELVKGRLREVQAARERLAKGSFGHCTLCGKPIDENRLAAKVDASLCIRCAKNSSRRNERGTRVLESQSSQSGTPDSWAPPSDRAPTESLGKATLTHGLV